MASWILVADGDPACRATLQQGLAAKGLADQVAACDSGRSLVTEYTRRLRAGDEVRAVVLETRLAAGGGKSAVIVLRAVERGFGAAPGAFVFHTTAPRDDNLDRVIAYVGRTAYRQRTEAPPLSQASVDDVATAIGEVLGA